jgi:hypothetical protein
MFMFVRTVHLQHTLNPPLYKKYSTGMYSTEELKHCVLARVCINQFVKLECAIKINN